MAMPKYVNDFHVQGMKVCKCRSAKDTVYCRSSNGATNFVWLRAHIDPIFTNTETCPEIQSVPHIVLIMRSHELQQQQKMSSEQSRHFGWLENIKQSNWNRENMKKKPSPPTLLNDINESLSSRIFLSNLNQENEKNKNKIHSAFSYPSTIQICSKHITQLNPFI